MTNKTLVSVFLILAISGVSYCQETVSWKFKTDGIVYSSPLIDGDAVYIGSADSFFYAININDGTEIWKYKAGNQIYSTAAVSENIICFESGNVLYGLNSDGTERWKVTISEGTVTNHYDDWDCFHSSPLIVDSIAYAGSERGAVIGVNIFTGAEVFRINTGDTGVGVRVKPAVYDNKIYFGEVSGKFYCYDLLTGEKVWSYDTNPEKLWRDPAILTNPVIREGVVYFGGRHCHLYALNAMTGNKIWMYSDPRNMWILGGPSISDSLIFVGSSNQKLIHSFNVNSGALLWTRVLDGRIFGTPFIDGNNIFLGTGMEINDKTGSLFALDKLTGEIVNRFIVNAQVHSSPIAAGGKIIFGCRDSYVYALDKEEMLSCVHPESGYIEEGPIGLGELDRDTTLIIGVRNSSTAADSVSFYLSAPGLYGKVSISTAELYLAPESENEVSVTILAASLTPRNYAVTLRMTRHYVIDPVKTEVNKSILFTVPAAVSVSEEGGVFDFRLDQNFPNPFNPSTKIKYSMANAGQVEVKIFNMIGEEISTLVNEYKEAGNYEIVYNAGDLPGGIYLCRMKSGNFDEVKKLVLLK